MGSLGSDEARHGKGRVCTAAVRRSACASTGPGSDPGAGGSTCMHRAKAHLGRVRAWLGCSAGDSPWRGCCAGSGGAPVVQCTGRWSGPRVLEPSAKDRGNRGGAYLVLNWAEWRLAAANGAAERRWPELGKKGGCGV